MVYTMRCFFIIFSKIYTITFKVTVGNFTNNNWSDIWSIGTNYESVTMCRVSDKASNVVLLALLSYSITGNISLITSLFITTTNSYTLLMSLGKYILVALLFIELKKISVLKKQYALLTLINLIWSSLMVVYMMLQS